MRARLMFVTTAAAAVATILAFFAYAQGDASSTFTVTSGADPGDGVCDVNCTLREALSAANLNGGHDVIDFDPAVFLPGAPVAISPSNALPASADSEGITIDGTGAGVIIDGGLLAGSEHGLLIQASGPMAALSDVTVRSVTVQNFPGNGIFVCGGEADTCDQVVSNILVEDVVSSGNGRYGIFARGGVSTTAVKVLASTTNGNGFVGTFVAGGTNTGTTISDVSSSNNGREGIVISGFISDNVDAQVTNVVTNGNGSQGVSICCFDMIRPVVANVTSTGNQYDNINIVGERVVDGRIENCTANGSQLFSGINVNAAIDNLTISDCEASGNGGIGVEVIAFDVTRMLKDASISDVSANNNGDSGIHVEATDSTLANVLIDDASASGNGNYGVFVRGGESTTDVEVRDLTSNLNDFQGTAVAGGTNTRTTISGVTSSNNGADGISVAGFITDLVDTQITDVVTNSNGDQGTSICCFDMVRPMFANVTSNDNQDQNINLVGERVLDATIQNCEANESQTAAGIFVSAETDNLTITDCEANENAGEGVWVWASDNRTIDGVSISNTDASGNGTSGVKFTGEDEVSDVSVVSSTFVDNASSGIETNGPMEAHFNRIFGNAVGLIGTAVDAENNWWGCNEGPNSAACDSTAGNVDANPWLTLDLVSEPDPAFAMSASEIAAGVVKNADGVDTSAEGHIQDGTLIGFTTDAGSINGAAVIPTISGRATGSLITEDEGIAQLTATLDNQAVTLALTILDATPAPTLTPTLTPTPTATPASDLVQGDNDCDGDVDAVDALVSLQSTAALPYNQQPGCLPLGDAVPAGVALQLFADIDCDGDVDAVDALQILRFVAALPANPNEGCTLIGQALG